MNQRLLWLVSCLLCLLWLPTATASARTWKDLRGNVVDAKFVRLARGTVYLQRGTKILQVPLQDLSRADQEHVRELVGIDRNQQSDSESSSSSDVDPNRSDDQPALPDQGAFPARSGPVANTPPTESGRLQNQPNRPVPRTFVTPDASPEISGNSTNLPPLVGKAPADASRPMPAENSRLPPRPALNFQPSQPVNRPSDVKTENKAHAAQERGETPVWAGPARCPKCDRVVTAVGAECWYCSQTVGLASQDNSITGARSTRLLLAVIAAIASLALSLLGRL